MILENKMLIGNFTSSLINYNRKRFSLKFDKILPLLKIIIFNNDQDDSCGDWWGKGEGKNKVR
ncbi:hypothetical protein DIT68_02870 [Brumimicrobium oceani]|uniref:Uncharacterized protein n=1 Tax=Brumimicrobium oceani TaxID=2100725 RepID=A0A2U2XHH1_9FLAO|nr:hypothetical protein DIT68_02870 [Brumimicrobium oceani]